MFNSEKNANDVAADASDSGMAVCCGRLSALDVGGSGATRRASDMELSRSLDALAGALAFPTTPTPASGAPGFGALLARTTAVPERSGGGTVVELPSLDDGHSVHGAWSSPAPAWRPLPASTPTAPAAPAAPAIRCGKEFTLDQLARIIRAPSVADHHHHLGTNSGAAAATAAAATAATTGPHTAPTTGAGANHADGPAPHRGEMAAPPYTYAALVYHAIKGTGQGAGCQVTDINEAMIRQWPYYRDTPDHGWKQSVRYNLTKHSCFRKARRGTGDQGRGVFWHINEDEARLQISFKLTRTRRTSRANPKPKTALSRPMKRGSAPAQRLLPAISG